MNPFFLTFSCLIALVSPIFGHNSPDIAPYKIVHTEELKEWIQSNKKMVIIDARTAAYDDGERLPNAIQISPDAPNDQIKASIPSLDTTVVVYCSSLECPASKWLASRLVEMGYTSIYKYPEGIHEWKEKGNKIVPAK